LVRSTTDPRRGAFAVLCVATAAYAVLQSLVVPALGVFQRELHTNPSGAAWILTAFLLSSSVSTPVLGRLADLYGKRPVLAGAAQRRPRAFRSSPAVPVRMRRSLSRC
jgi:MFS family permease